MGEIATIENDVKLANDVMKFAILIKDAKDFIPSSMRGNAGAIAACMLAGMELGFKMMASLRLLYCYNGNIGVYAKGMAGLLKMRGYEVEWPIQEEERVGVKLTSPNGKIMTMTYTKDDAVKACLWNLPTWKKHPKSMLRARCISNAVGLFAAEVLAGIYSPDEIDEIREREEKLINPKSAQGKAPRKLGVEAVLDDLGLNDEVEEFKEVENVEAVDVEAVEVIEDSEEDPEYAITDAELISDEMRCANNVKQLDLCAKKVKLACITEDQKELLRLEYKKLKEGLSDG